MKRLQIFSNIAMVLYVVGNIAEKALFVYVSVSFYENFEYTEIIWVLLPITYAGFLFNMLMLMYFLYMSFNFIDVLVIKDSKCKRVLIKLVICLVSVLFAINIAAPTLIDSIYFYL